jgi:Permease family
MMISGVLGLILAKPFSMIIRFFPPLVAGTVIWIIGLSLGGADIALIAPTVVNGANVAEVSNVVLAGIVVLSIILISRLFTGFFSPIAVLLSIVIGTIVAAFMGKVDFSNLSHAAWFGGPQIFRFGDPKFTAAPIITMCIVMIVTFTESTADMLAVGEMVDKDLKPNDLARGLATDALSAFIASFTNSFPDTAFAENVGLVGLTGIRSRWVVTACGDLPADPGPDPEGGTDRRRPARAGDRWRRHDHVLDGHRGRDPDVAQGQLPQQPQPADRRGLARGWLVAGIRPELLRQVPEELPGDLRIEHHRDGDRGVRPQPRVQRVRPPRPGRVRGAVRGG